MFQTGVFFELSDNIDIFDCTGDGDGRQLGERCLCEVGSTSMLSFPMWLKAMRKGVSSVLKKGWLREMFSILKCPPNT